MNASKKVSVLLAALLLTSFVFSSIPQDSNIPQVQAAVSGAGQYFSPGIQGVAERASSDVNNLDYTKDFSVEILAYIPPFEEQGRSASYIGGAGWSMDGSHEYINTYTHGINFAVSDGANSASVAFNYAGYAHMVLTWDATAKTLSGYINGTSYKKTSVNTNVNSANIKTGALKISGNSSRSYDYGWGTSNSDVSFARLWNRKLSDSDVSAIYSNWKSTGQHSVPSGVDRSELKSEWLMDSTSDKTGGEGTAYLKDNVGSNHLEIKGTAFLQKEEGAFSIVSPISGAVNVGSSAYLDVSGGADLIANPVMPYQYYFQVDESPIFSSSNLKESGWIEYSKWQPVLKPATTYYWRVKVRDSSAVAKESPYSRTISFATRVSKNWYVRPHATTGTYGSENGFDYNNAFNGLTKLNYGAPSLNNTHGITWGPGGVEAGDTLYVCGKHALNHGSNNSFTHLVGNLYIPINGYSDEYPVTIRTDCPQEAGIVWGFSKYDSYSVGWNGPDANGVYYTDKLLSAPLASDLDNSKAAFLLKEKATTWTGNAGYWYKDATRTYVKMPDGGNPAGRVYAKSNGYQFLAEHRKYIKFQNCDFRGYRFVDQQIDVGPYPRSTHITWDGCTLQYGTPLIELKRGNDYWTIRNSILKNSSSAIYAWNNKEGTSGCYTTIENNKISNLGTYEYGLSDGDNHAVGAQGASNWLIQNNYIENTGSAIEFWNGIWPKGRRMIDNIIRWNFIKNINKMSVTEGHGIVISGENGGELGERTGFEVYGNIIIDTEGHGISSNNPDPEKIYNNTLVHFGTIGNDPDGHGIRESISSSIYPAAIITKNNLLLNTANKSNTDVNRQYFFHVYSPYSSSLEKIDIDYNGYYPNADVGYQFGVSGALHKKFSDMVSITGLDTHSFITNPLIVKEAGALTDLGGVKLQWNSPAIDAGTNVGLTADYYGNLIYGAPDIGAIEYQPPYTIGTDKPYATANIRIYANGRFRNKANPSGAAADISVSPQSGFISNNYSQWMDLEIQQWDSSTTTKKWKESLGATSYVVTNHQIGDLASGKNYSVYYTKTGGLKTKLDTKQANSQGRIIFNYDKGYSSVVFEIEEDNSSAPTSNEPPAPAPAPAPATCSDGIKNQSETGTDCGGPCSACAVLTPTPTPTQTQTQTPTQAQAQTPTQAQAQTPTTGGSSVSSDTSSTISVRLNVSPNIGHAPLNVNLDAFVSGTAVGPVNYTFYCDRNDSGVNITTPYSAKYDSITSITNSFPCVYSSPGVYTAKVIIERGNALPTEVRATITALAPGEVIPTAPQPAAETTPTTTTPAITPPMAEAAIFTKAMYPGFKHEEVTKLQQYLSQDASLYPEKEITGYFGELTLKAVQRFQTKYSIVSSGTSATTGYGLVGPATRAKLNEVFGSTSFDKAQDKPLTTGGAISAPTPTSAETEALVNQLIAQIRLLQEQLMQILTQLTQLLQQQIQQKLGQ